MHLLSIFVVSVLVGVSLSSSEESVSDGTPFYSKLLKKVTVPIKRAWRNVKTFYHNVEKKVKGIINGEMTMDVSSIQYRFPQMPNGFDELKDKISEFRKYARNNPTLRTAFAIYINVAIVLIVYFLLIMKHVTLSRRMKMEREPEKLQAKRRKKSKNELIKQAKKPNLDLSSRLFSPRSSPTETLQEEETESTAIPISIASRPSRNTLDNVNLFGVTPSVPPSS